MKRQTIMVLDFGGEYSQLLARKIRGLSVYCEILPYNTCIDEIKGKQVNGIILSGNPNSEYETPEFDRCPREIFNLGVPILGICYGAQAICHLLDEDIYSPEEQEYGKSVVYVDTDSKLFAGVDRESICWMSQADYIKSLPEGFEIIGNTEKCPIAAFEDDQRQIYGVQFHPEVNHTKCGDKILENFIYNICDCRGDWTTSNFVDWSINSIRDKVGDGKVLCGLSGGVDSSVAAVLVHKAIGDQLTCIFVDHGLLRKNEGEDVVNFFKEEFNLNIIKVDAKDRFLSRLDEVTDPETKRKIIGEEFIRVFEEEALKIGKVDYLVQGTIYPDVIESGVGRKGTIKSHHNVGGLPDNIEFKGIIEPLRQLFKDEVREVGLELGMPGEVVWRQPFPGPGLAVRIIGDITEEKLHILKEADAIYREEIAREGLAREIWQYFAVLTSMKSVGVSGDGRTYDYTIALRAVNSIDGMTAQWAKIPFDVLEKISSRITDEVPNVNRVVYDISNKPPATIEWE